MLLFSSFLLEFLFFSCVFEVVCWIFKESFVQGFCCIRSSLDTIWIFEWKLCIFCDISAVFDLSWLNFFILEFFFQMTQRKPALRIMKARPLSWSFCLPFFKKPDTSIFLSDFANQATYLIDIEDRSRRAEFAYPEEAWKTHWITAKVKSYLNQA